MVLAAAGTGPEHVVRLNIYLVHGVDAQVGYAASRSVWGAHRSHHGCFHRRTRSPGAIVEIDAVTIIPKRKPSAR